MAEGREWVHNFVYALIILPSFIYKFDKFVPMKAVKLNSTTNNSFVLLSV